jgi:hypothetical protein
MTYRFDDVAVSLALPVTAQSPSLLPFSPILSSPTIQKEFFFRGQFMLNLKNLFYARKGF